MCSGAPQTPQSPPVFQSRLMRTPAFFSQTGVPQLSPPCPSAPQPAHFTGGYLKGRVDCWPGSESRGGWVMCPCLVLS